MVILKKLGPVPNSKYNLYYWIKQVDFDSMTVTERLLLTSKVENNNLTPSEIECFKVLIKAPPPRKPREIDIDDIFF